MSYEQKLFKVLDCESQCAICDARAVFKMVIFSGWLEHWPITIIGSVGLVSASRPYYHPHKFKNPPISPFLKLPFLLFLFPLL